MSMPGACLVSFEGGCEMATAMTRVDLIMKIQRKERLVRKWTLAASQCTGTDAVSQYTRKYSLGLARAAREKLAEYEEQFRRLNAPSPG